MKVVSKSEMAAIHGGFAPLNWDGFPNFLSPQTDLGLREIFTPLSQQEFFDAYGIVADT